MKTPRSELRRAPRTTLSRERILEAARRLADDGGIEAVSMRRIAQELGVEAMTLYYHVPNKAEIVGGIVDSVVAEFELPPAGAHWKAALRATAISAYRSLARHRWAAGAMLAARMASPARLRYMDAVLEALARAGLSPRESDHAYHVLEGHIMGFTLWESAINLGGREELRVLATNFLRALPADEFPNVAAHIEHHLEEPPPGDEGAFAFGLDLILDGLERIAGRA